MVTENKTFLNGPDQEWSFGSDPVTKQLRSGHRVYRAVLRWSYMIRPK